MCKEVVISVSTLQSIVTSTYAIFLSCKNSLTLLKIKHALRSCFFIVNKCSNYVDIKLSNTPEGLGNGAIRAIRQSHRPHAQLSLVHMCPSCLSRLPIVTIVGDRRVSALPMKTLTLWCHSKRDLRKRFDEVHVD